MATAQGGKQILGKVDVVSVPVIMQHEFQFGILVPQKQIVVRVLDISVTLQRQVRTVPNCPGDREDLTGAVLGLRLVASVVSHDRCRSWS